MEDTRERSFLRLAAGFAAGMGLMFAGLPFAPKAALITPERLVQSEPAKQAAVSEDNREIATVAPETPQIEIAAAPAVVDSTGAAVILPKQQRAPKRQAEASEVVSSPVVERPPESPQVIVEVRAAPGGNELLVFARPGNEPSPKGTDAARFVAVNPEHVGPLIYGTAEPLPPAVDDVAKTVDVNPVELATLDTRRIDAPDASLAAPRREPRVVTRSLIAPQAPSAPDAPLGTITTDIEVTVNTLGQRPDPAAGETAGLLAAVTGADRTPRQALTTTVTSPDESETQAPDQADGTAPPAPPISTGPAFEAFAADFEDDGGKSLLSVILIDPGEQGMDRSLLSNLSFPVTFAIPANDPRARFIEAEYRKKGFEVLAMVPSEGPEMMDKRTKPGDVAGLVRSYRDNVPSAIGVIDYPGGAIHQNSRLFQALSESLAESGQAVLTNKLRINNSDRIASAAGVPFAKVLRPIDADGSAPSVRRALERASLTASKSGGAVVIAYAETETVKTLYEWLLSNSSRSIAVAPVSAVIKRLEQN